MCDDRDVYILLIRTITIAGGANKVSDANKRINERNKIVVFKNCAPFTKCISEINNAQTS